MNWSRASNQLALAKQLNLGERDSTVLWKKRGSPFVGGVVVKGVLIRDSFVLF